MAEGRMSDDELRGMVTEIEGVAKAIMEAMPSEVKEGQTWDSLTDSEREDLGKLAAAAIDRRDEQVRRKMERPTRVLLLEAPIEGELADTPIDQLFPNQVVQGSLSLIADADEVYVFRGDKARTMKHRDYEPENVHVAIQRRSS